MFISFDLLLLVGERAASAYRRSQGDIVLRRVNTGEDATRKHNTGDGVCVCVCWGREGGLPPLQVLAV